MSCPCRKQAENPASVNDKLDVLIAALQQNNIPKITTNEPEQEESSTETEEMYYEAGGLAEQVELLEVEILSVKTLLGSVVKPEDWSLAIERITSAESTIKDLVGKYADFMTNASSSQENITHFTAKIALCEVQISTLSKANLELHGQIKKISSSTSRNKCWQPRAINVF